MALGYQELLDRIDLHLAHLADLAAASDELRIRQGELARQIDELGVGHDDRRYVATVELNEVNTRLGDLAVEMSDTNVEINLIRSDLELINIQRYRHFAPHVEVLHARPPATTIASVDVGELAGDLEPLLHLADQFVGDDRNPPGLRDVVQTRADALRGELRIYDETTPRDAVIITRAAGYLIATLTPGVVAELGDDTGETAGELGAISTAAGLLGDDTTAVDGAEQLAQAITEPADTDTAGDGDTVRAAAGRGLRNWVEHDLFDKHVNRATGAALTGAGLAGANVATGGKITAIFRAARALLQARFPWIFT